MSKLTFRYRHLGVQYPFALQGPYTEGHQLTAGEAAALNQLRLENIRENCRPIFEGEAGAYPAGELISQEAQARVQQAIEAYDAEYQFADRGAQAPKPGSIEKEARILAEARCPDGASEEEIELLAQSIDLLAEAQERVAIRQRIAQSEMEELLK